MIRSRTSSRSRRPSAPRSPPNSLKCGRQPIGAHRENPALVDTQAGRPSELAVVRDCIRLRLTAVDGWVKEPPPESAYKTNFSPVLDGRVVGKSRHSGSQQCPKNHWCRLTFRSNALMRFRLSRWRLFQYPACWRNSWFSACRRWTRARSSATSGLKFSTGEANRWMSPTKSARSPVQRGHGVGGWVS